MEFVDFILPFGGKLKKDNRWVILSTKIPWERFEQMYREKFSKSPIGTPAKTARIALGALIIKEKLGLTDEETVNQIQENPYLQYFLGYTCYLDNPPFDPSLMVYFRKRFDLETINQINDMVLEVKKKKSKKIQKKKDDDDHTNIKNKGKLIIDATCTPSDIRYPTDLSLLNEAREKAEYIIDVLYKPIKKIDNKKPRDYRRVARKDFLNIAKKKNKNKKEIRKAIRKQLNYLKRDLKYIKELARKSSTKYLSNYWYKCLLVINEVYRQQKWMHENRTNRIDSRIVSISQPHVRPIVRGKDKTNVEFGAKVSVSLVNGYNYLDKLSWDAYNESSDLIEQIEKYYIRFGCYPKSIHADKIYRTRKNIGYCKNKNIRFSGPKLGRPKKVEPEQEQKRLRRRQRLDERARIPIEGKFGNGKRRYKLDQIMTKLPETSESKIGIIFLVINLEKILRDFLFVIFQFLSKLKFKMMNFYILSEIM